MPFWKDAALADHERELLDLVYAAHSISAFRDNASTVALRHAAAGSGHLESAIAAALCSVGGRHAPIAAITEFLKLEAMEVLVATKKTLDDGGKVLGWGNSFFKGRDDPDWGELRVHLKTHYSEMWAKIAMVTEVIHAKRYNIYPNAGCYTAAVAIILGIPAPLAPYLLIRGRLDAWTGIAAQFL